MMKAITKHLVPNVGTLVIVGLLFLAQSVGALPGAAPAEPSGPGQTLISYQGTLTDKSGNPLNQSVAMEFAFYNAPSGGNLLWGPEAQNVDVVAGLFQVLLGSAEPIDPTQLTDDLHLGITVNGEEMMPRELLTSVAQAGVAGTLFPGATIGGDLNVVSGDIKFDNGRGLIAANGGKLMTGPGGATWQTWPGSAAASSFAANDANGNVAFAVYGTGNASIHGNLGMNGNPVSEVGNIFGHGLQQIHMPSGGSSIYFNWHRGSGVEFGGGDEVSDVSITPAGIDVHGNGIYNCGALTEANLQTTEELAAERIDRFEEGDILCWGIDRLEKCAIANDRLVQAVADANGRPIVIGAELVKVVGPVKRGDILVASDVPGYAMVNNDPISGSVIAQALEDFEEEQGIIKAMIRKW